MRKICATVAALLLGVAAAAPDRPLAVPTRDVDVVYRALAQGNTPATEQRVRWDVAAGKQRIDPQTPGIYVIIDFRARQLFSVRDSIRTVLEFNGERAPSLPNYPAGRYASVGTATVAGLDCTLWQPNDSATPPRQICVTDDGVLLRIAAAERTLLEAVSVHYAPADPAAFEVPADYKHIVPQENPQEKEKAP